MKQIKIGQNNFTCCILVLNWFEQNDMEESVLMSINFTQKRK